jgi:hypothetical protein
VQRSGSRLFSRDAVGGVSLVIPAMGGPGSASDSYTFQMVISATVSVVLENIGTVFECIVWFRQFSPYMYITYMPLHEDVRFHCVAQVREVSNIVLV